MTDIEEEPASTIRAEKIKSAMENVYDDDDPASALTNLLADARHFADVHGLAFAEHDRRAQWHYRAELTPSPPFVKKEESPSSVQSVQAEPSAFTVLLLYPDTLADNYGEDTYLTCVKVTGPREAVGAAIAEAVSENEGSQPED